MKASNSRFDHIKFRLLIETELGHGGIKKLSDAIDVTPKTVHSWMNGNTKAGPQISSWDNMKKYFAKRNIILKREEYYVISVDDISEPHPHPYNKGDESSIQEMIERVSSMENDVSSMKNVLKNGIEKFEDSLGVLKTELKRLQK